MAAFDALLRETLIVAALLSLPVLAIATLVGTVVAVLQAATQVQEQTLSLLPNLLIVGGALALFGSAGMHLCAQLFRDVLTLVPGIAAG
jgi:flagellar biosynthetic protein FliQ